MHKVGILRGPSLNPYEGYFKNLAEFGFLPIGITTYDTPTDLSEIPYPTIVGHNFKTLTKGYCQKVQSFVGKITRFNFQSYNYLIYNLKGITKGLEIIHSADIWYPYTYQAVKTGIPTVVTEWENIPFNVEELPYAKIKRYNLNHVTHFVAITEKAKKALIIEGAKEEKISVIPAGLDCEKFKPSQKNTQLTKQFGVAEDSTKILFVGRLVPEKGIFDLLKAFSMLIKNNHQNLELLIVGSGTMKLRWEINELISSLKIRQKVKFLGSIKYSDMPQIHNMADIFCLPSVETKVWAEQFGYSIVEAMACAKPVVSTFTGSLPEIVKHCDTGILVEPNSPTALKTALEELVVDQVKREHFGKAGRDWVLNRFEASKVAGQIAEVYRMYI